MDTRKHRFWLFTIVMLVCLIASPTGASSLGSCNVTMTLKQPNPTSPTSILKYLMATPATGCGSPMGMGANCYSFPPPGTMAPPFAFTAVGAIKTTGPSPFCSWVCNCGTITVDGSDGLPVELMDFSIE